jgi:hypothetical protein
MDHSTEGVTLLNAFVFDVLREYGHLKRVAAPAFSMARGLSEQPDTWCSIDIYNNVCQWIEVNIGAASIRKAGMAIGARAYDNIVTHRRLSNPTPLAMMEALQWAASVMIRDPKGRGWEILGSDNFSIVMRRTQTFNCMMQDGLLQSMIERTGVEGVEVDHERCTRKGDAFCDYRITWVPAPG